MVLRARRLRGRPALGPDDRADRRRRRGRGRPGRVRRADPRRASAARWASSTLSRRVGLAELGQRGVGQRDGVAHADVAARPRRCRTCPGAGRTALPPGAAHAEPGTARRARCRGTRRSPRRPCSARCRRAPRGPSAASTAARWHVDRRRVVDDRRHAADVGRLGPHAERGDDLVDQRRGPAARRRPRRRGRSTRSVPRSRPDIGIALAARPASTEPHTIDSAARGSTRRDSTPGRSVISRPERVDDVLGEVRAGGVPARCRDSATSTWSQAAVIGADPHADRPGRRAAGRSAARRSARRPSSAPASTTVGAPPGTVSSAGWKISRTRAGRAGPPASSRGRGQQDRGVRVVPAAVAHARRPSSGRARPSGPAAAARRCRRAGRRPGRRCRCRRPRRCRAAARPGARPERAAAAPTISSVVRCSAKASSGCACRSRRSATTSIGPGSAARSSGRRVTGASPSRISASSESTTGSSAPSFAAATARWRW